MIPLNYLYTNYNAMNSRNLAYNNYIRSTGMSGLTSNPVVLWIGGIVLLFILLKLIRRPKATPRAILY